MRIVAGAYRGRLLAVPEGRLTRPTADRVREALFSSIYSLRGELDGAVVLDAFAGSGALGLEALSRGASRALFYEIDPKACAVLRKNIDACQARQQAEVRSSDIMAKPPLARAPLDVVFLDPPYALGADKVMSLVGSLRQSGCLDESSLIVYEHSAESARAVEEEARKGGIEILKTKRYGKTTVAFAAIQSTYGHTGQ